MFYYLECSLWLYHHIYRYGNTKCGDGTLYDPIHNLIRVARSELNTGKHFIDAFGKALEAAEYSISLSKKAYKYPDSGAHAVGIWMRALFEGVKLSCPT